ncbi:MAG: hypothetical protein KBF93_10250, partial [Leptospiraceae bacterium]|nr:hypothetical protein [Leptospiraceae bacterium]
MNSIRLVFVIVSRRQVENERIGYGSRCSLGLLEINVRILISHEQPSNCHSQNFLLGICGSK